jgi:hypothetical protein
LSVLLALLIAVIGIVVVFYGHKAGNEYLGVSLAISGGVALILSILWMGDLFGFQAGLDAGKLLFIMKVAVIVWVVALFLIWIGIEALLKGFWSSIYKS